jgi:hypothetical protein
LIIKKSDILEWTEVIYDPENELIPEVESDWKRYGKTFINQLAELLYEDIRRSGQGLLKKKFNRLKAIEKAAWYDYSSRIPSKLKLLNLFIRPFDNFFRTCIITDEEVERLAFIDHEYYQSESQLIFSDHPGDHKTFFKELNYFIPAQLKKTGYEIIRKEEDIQIDIKVVRKLAKAIHARYLQKMRNINAATDINQSDSLPEYPVNQGIHHLTEFNDLPEEIIYSNIDNAFHIPTKLLSIGYKIRPVQKGFKPLTLHLNDDEIETMARIEHLRWSWDKRLNGYIYSNNRNNEKKTHPGLIPYEKLSEPEKEKDRELVRLIPSLLQDIDYVAYPVVPDVIKNLSYSIKPQSSVNKLLNETRKLNEEVREMSSSHPAIREKLKIINKKIEETISEVQGSYNYAQHIQETYLPEGLFIRECFPDSFILFKPKDIVSGDFYFFSKKDNLITFAAGDCTGHGIPGALLSTLGYGITNQAVNEIMLTEPSEILQHLYSKVHRFLRKGESGMMVTDDMDIALCTLELKTGILTYSGVGNPIYIVSRGELNEHKAKNIIENCDSKEDC